MKASIVTLFPDMVEAVLTESLLGKAVEKGLIAVDVVNLRDFTEGRHQVADDYPYGGGAGMVLKPEPIFRAVESLKQDAPDAQVIYMSPQGERFSHEMALSLAADDRKQIFLCGRYEGIDERARVALVDREISIGDYVLSGGELPALVVIEAAARFVPGVLGDERSADQDSFADGLLDYPHYTRPPEFRDMKVPEVLLSGNHEKIRAWRRKEALRATAQSRPDLLAVMNEQGRLSAEDIGFLREIRDELGPNV